MRVLAILFLSGLALTVSASWLLPRITPPGALGSMSRMMPSSTGEGEDNFWLRSRGLRRSLRLWRGDFWKAYAKVILRL